MGPLLYLLYTNYLPLGINSASRSIVYAYDKSILLLGKSIQDLQIKSVPILNSLSKWFTINELPLNLDKTKMKFDLNHLQNASFQLLLQRYTYKGRY